MPGPDVGNEMDRGVLAEVIEHISQALSHFDSDLNLVVCNRRFLELLDFPEEMGRPGTPLAAFFRYNAERGEYGEDGDIETMVAERLALARRFEPHSFERERPDGMVLRIQGAPVATGGFVTTYTDITELRRSQQALAQANERLDERVRERTEALARRESELSMKTATLETILESINSGITLFDNDLRLVVANRRFFDLLDLPLDLAAPGTPFEAFMRFNAERGEYGPGDVEELTRQRVEAAKRFEPHRFTRERPDGSIIEVLGRPVSDGFVTTYTDVTEQKQAEALLRAANEELEARVSERTAELHRQLRETERAEAEMRAAKERAERANRAKTEFLAQMSHELRTPLNSIIGFSEVCRNELFGPIGHDKYAEYIEAVNRSGSHLLSLINDILEMARLESGKVALEEETIDLAETVADTVMLLSERAASAGVTLENATGEAPVPIRGDGRRVRQMILNLLANALKFTEHGGTVTVSARRDQARGEQCLTVRDTGVGMDPADVSYAIEPFTQVSGGSVLQAQEGTGLGLPIVNTLIRQHGGRLEIETAPGEGLTARLVFPPSRALSTGAADG